MRNACAIGVICFALAGNARAQAPAPPAPYSLPWQLRPALPVNVLRSDTTVALRDEKGKDGVSVASFLVGAWKATSWFSPMVRLGVVGNYPSVGASATSFLNPMVGATFALKLPHDFRLALFLGVTIPVGTGGGDNPDAAQAAANKAAILNRSSLDAAMIRVNYLSILPGVTIAYVAGGFTAQLDATVLQFIRVRGETKDPDPYITNFTSGLHLGYFVIPQLSFGMELRYQRWLSNPQAVVWDATGASRDTLTVALGVRAHVKLGKKAIMRPGIAVAAGLDDPMAAQSYRIIQFDVPILFN